MNLRTLKAEMLDVMEDAHNVRHDVDVQKDEEGIIQVIVATGRPRKFAKVYIHPHGLPRWAKATAKLYGPAIVNALEKAGAYKRKRKQPAPI